MQKFFAKKESDAKITTVEFGIGLKTTEWQR